MSGMPRGTLKEVRDGSGDPRNGFGRVRGPSRRSLMGQGTQWEVWEESGALGEVRDGSSDPRGNSGRIEGSLGWSETGWGTLGEDRDGSGDPRRDPGHLGRSVSGQGTREEV